MATFFQTIVAPITGTQPAAVAIIRVSGPESWKIASQIFHKWPSAPESHKAIYGRLETGDNGLALPFSENHSYTGDETVEFSIHGSPASVRSLVELCVRNGARMAEPGEFTQRAFLNGRMDLTQAEGVRDTILSQTDAQLRQANQHRGGVLHRQVLALRQEILTLLVGVEASVDFSEEIGEFDREDGLKRLKIVNEEVDLLLKTAPAGRILREGFRVAIVGPPNAGKSSLMNALLGADRSIVTEVPGTTRDYLEEQVELDGVLCVLFDTAGLRESDDRVESIGIQRAKAIAANVDEIWYLFDAVIGLSEDDEAAIKSFDRPVLVLANKSDLVTHERPGQILAISAVTRLGFEKLIGHVQDKIDGASERPFVNARHGEALTRVSESLQTCLDCLNHSLPEDLLSVGLRAAASELGTITGETATPDVIDRIFHDFCIGK